MIDISFEWFTITWLMQNLHWIIIFLSISIIILFLFPLLLGHDIKQKSDEIDNKNQ